MMNAPMMIYCGAEITHSKETIINEDIDHNEEEANITYYNLEGVIHSSMMNKQIIADGKRQMMTNNGMEIANT